LCQHLLRTNHERYSLVYQRLRASINQTAGITTEHVVVIFPLRPRDYVPLWV